MKPKRPIDPYMSKMHKLEREIRRMQRETRILIGMCCHNNEHPDWHTINTHVILEQCKKILGKKK